MPQFVILRHDDPRGVHFDFMLEAGDVLKTWAMPTPPEPNATIEATALPDHRLAYLDYEGPVSGDRGSVTRWDRGDFTTTQQNETLWLINLTGEKLIGNATLRQTDATANRWQVLLHAPGSGDLPE